MEFDLDPLVADKKKFYVKKKDFPENGAENIELLNYLLFIRENETEDDVLDEISTLIDNICSVCQILISVWVHTRKNHTL